jgi:hypothetical protein
MYVVAGRLLTYNLCLQPAQYVLFEAASCYALFEVVEAEEISSLKAEVQASVTDLARCSKLVKFKAYHVRAASWESHMR